MVLNHDQRIASKIAIRRILALGISDPDELDRAMVIVEEIYMMNRVRTDIYMDMKRVLQTRFEIDPFIFYFIILKDIDQLFKTGLNHLDVFIESDLDSNDKQQ